MPSRPVVPPAVAGSAPDAPTRHCPSCGTAAPAGRFCTECGATLESGTCAVCRAQLDEGAKFCHRCGTATGAAGAAGGGTAPPPAAPGGRRPLSAAVPWTLAALALVALIAFVAGRSFSGAARPSAGAEAPPVEGVTEPAAGAVAGGPARAPDISRLSPSERADRLYDRIMRLNEEGKRDSVDLFAPMAVAAYEMLGPLDLDAHYDLGRIGEAAGVPSLAQAEADTILRADPTHLLGLALAARVASAAQQPAASRGFYRRLLAAAPSEEKKSLPEYTRHRHDIDAALAEARKTGSP